MFRIFVLMVLTTVPVICDDLVEIDEIPQLSEPRDSAWLIVMRPHVRRTRGMEINICYQRSGFYELENNSLAILRIPSGQGILCVEDEDEFVTLDAKPGRYYFVALRGAQYGNKWGPDDVLISVMSAEETESYLQEADDADDMELYMLPDEQELLDDDDWEDVWDDYQEWLEDSQEDVDRWRAVPGSKRMFRFEFDD
jgi:hypothetical protein